jgi:phosphatidate cytidylyltransferase
MFSARLATAAALLAAFVSALFYLPNPWWRALLILILLGASWEWGGLARYAPNTRWAFCALVVGSALALWLGAGPGLGATVLLISCAFWLLVAPLWMAMRWRVDSPAALMLTGWIVLVPTWLALGRLQAEPAPLLVLLGVVWVADTGAYLAGKAWGKHKLAVAISPGKTWEGVAGAVAAVAVYYVAVSRWLPEWDWWRGGWGAVLFAGLAVVSIVGDLFESWMKRQAGTKDSGALLPGHGGILDRIDSMTSSMPIAAVLLLYMK